MPEILTESFCERCGTRYTFESAAPRAARLQGIKVLSRGLRNFVMSDDTSIDEAMAAARSDADREATGQQLEAFHKTFNFCMSCRQYTCGECWNEAVGRCLTCAPADGLEPVAPPFPDLQAQTAPIDPAALEPATNGTNGHRHAAPLDWPTTDLVDDASATATRPTDPIPFTWPTGPSVDQAGDSAAPDGRTIDAAAPPPAATEAIAPPTPHGSEPSGDAAFDPAEIDARAAAAAEQTQDLFGRFRPGQSLDAEIAAYEASLAGTTDVAPEAAAPAEIVAEPEIVAEAPEAPVPEPQVAAEQFEAPAPPARPLVDIVEQPTWRYLAPDRRDAEAEAEAVAEPEPEPGVRPPAAAAPPVPPAPAAPLIPTPTPAVPTPPAAATPDPSPAPVIPPAAGAPMPTPPPTNAQRPEPAAAPQWPAPTSAAGLPFLGRPIEPVASIESLWAESAREVASAPAARPTSGVAPCVNCGLSLSATARFCRRCGTRQG